MERRVVERMVLLLPLLRLLGRVRLGLLQFPPLLVVVLREEEVGEGVLYVVLDSWLA